MVARCFFLALVLQLDWASAAYGQTRAPLTLPDALARTYSQTPALMAARARVDAARLAAERAGRPLNPLIEVRSENWASGVGLPLDVFATVTQTVELGGKRGARKRVADAGLGVASAVDGVLRRDVALEVTHNYLEALRHREHARAHAAHAASLTEAARIMRRRVDVGAAAEADWLRVRTEEARAVIDHTRRELDAVRAVTDLGARVGADVSLDQLQMPVAPVIPVADTPLGDGHPDLAAAASTVGLARSALGLERARWVPDLGINAGVKRTAGYNTGVAALTVPVPLFDKNVVARTLADGQLRAAELERDAVDRRTRATFAATRTAATRLAETAGEVRRTVLEPARGARDAARAAFAAGALDVWRLVDAERVCADAERVTIDVEIDAVSTAIQARIAAGEAPLP